jgi:hypothetical protein
MRTEECSRVIKSFICLIAAALFLLGGCKTNPPNAPDDIGTGKIFLNIKLQTPAKIGTVDKTVLLEDFANVSCDPCVTSNKIIESFTNVRYGPSKLVAAKFPTNFPSPNDPFYLAIPEICNARMLYYNIFFAPTTIIDGILYPISTDSISIIEKIDERLALSPQFGLGVSDSTAGGNYFINVTLQEINTIGLNLSEIVLHTVITETDIEFENPPGSNGETKFYDVVRSTLPTLNGESVANIVQSGEISYEIDETLSTLWDMNNVHTVVYIQNMMNKEVYQAASTIN